MQGYRQCNSGPEPLDIKRSPFLATRFAVRSPRVTYRDDGTIILGNAIAPDLTVSQMGVFLRRYADLTPDAVFLAERRRNTDAVEWDGRTYGAVRRDVDAASQWLIDHGADGTRPVAILSHNSIRHGILQLAAMQIGVPVLALSPAYSLVSKDHRKLIGLVETFAPSHIFVEDTQPFAAALSRLENLDGRLIAGIPSAPFAYALTSTVAGPEVEARFAAVSPDSVARILLTSGSTGDPKGVMITQRMMLAVAEGFATVWPFLLDRPPVMVDWTPPAPTAPST